MITMRPGPYSSPDGGCQLSNPHHVEQDVQQPAVQPAGAQHRPPAAEPEDGAGPGRAEQELDLSGGREKAEEAGAGNLMAPHDRHQQGPVRTGRCRCR